MAKKKDITYEEKMSALDEQRISSYNQGDYAAYAALCDEMGVDPEDTFAYERGCVDRRELTPINELSGGLEEVVKQEEVAVDDKMFGDTVARSFVAGSNARPMGNLKTNNASEYANWIASAFLDLTERHRGYGVKIGTSSGVSSGRMRRVYMGALFYERPSGKGRYATEYSVGFDEDHDDMDKTKPEDYQAEQLDLLRGLVSQTLPNANVVVKNKYLYVFKKE